MKTDQLEKVIGAVREQSPAAGEIRSAAERVRARLFGKPVAAEAASGLRGCADFRELIPAYVSRSLSPAKSLLLTDHTHSCVACRRALERERSGNVRVLPRPKTASTQVSPATRWSVAAAVLVTASLAGWWAAHELIVPPGVRADVENVSGNLYRLAGSSSTPIFAGRALGERDIVRTAKNSTAELRLADGSTVEMNERSQLSVSRASRGTTIRLERGNIIVHAAKQRQGALYVKTRDCEVMVKGTIFAVTSGTKGSRVAVAEGAVKVYHDGQSETLQPGAQLETSPAVGATPIQDEFSWSRDSAKYLAVLGEFSSLQKQIEQIPAAGLRTSSKLLDYVPANTAIYAAIPNVGSTIGEAYRLFSERMQGSPVLQQWWAEQGHNDAGVRTVVDKIQTLGGYLGDEIVLAIPATDEGGPGKPIVLAEARQGLQEFVRGEIANASPQSGMAAMQLVGDASSLGAQTADSKKTMVYMSNGVVGLSADPARITELAERLAQTGAPSGFAGTDLHDRILQSYQSGAGWLFSADFSRVRLQGADAQKEHRAAVRKAGFDGVRFLTVERKEVSGQTQNKAVLSFAGQSGMAAWLAAPAPMATLDFVSPDAAFATSMVINNPGVLLSQLFSQFEADNADAAAKINAFESETGVNIVGDIADSLGGEATFAVDGPLLPVPSWKLAAEVYNPSRLEWAIERLINAFNKMPNTPGQLTLAQSQNNGLTYYRLTGSSTKTGQLPAEVDWVYTDGYLLAAANQDLLTSSIQNRNTGYTLPRSDKFRAQLPKDGNSNFSALVYHNIGGLVNPVAEQLNGVNALSAGQKSAIAALQANSAPGLIYAYSANNEITISANGGLFGFSIDSLALPKVIEHIMHRPGKTQ